MSRNSRWKLRKIKHWILPVTLRSSRQRHWQGFGRLVEPDRVTCCQNPMCKSLCTCLSIEKWIRRKNAPFFRACRRLERFISWNFNRGFWLSSLRQAMKEHVFVKSVSRCSGAKRLAHWIMTRQWQEEGEIGYSVLVVIFNLFQRSAG